MVGLRALTVIVRIKSGAILGLAREIWLVRLPGAARILLDLQRFELNILQKYVAVGMCKSIN